MSVTKSAAIIGAGIGGLTTAVFLARAGYKVTVYEKNGFAGGRCSRYVKDGHRFDLGATIFLMPETYRQVFRSLGFDLDELFEFRKPDTLYSIYFDDGTVLDFSADREKMRLQLEALEPGSYDRMKDYVSQGYHFLELGMNRLLNRNFYHWYDFINLKNIGLLARLKVHLRHYAFARRFFRNEHLRMAFTFQNIYVGQSPFTAPALFAMLPAAELVQGSLSPRGGMAAVPEKMMALARDLGVSIEFDRTVEKILTGKRKATGLRLADGAVIPADIVVAGADLPYVYNRLLPASRKARRLKRMRYSCSALTFHWALDLTYPGFSQHNVFLCDEYRECLEAIFSKDVISGKPCFYVNLPARSDPAAAPEGADTLSVLVPVGHVDPTRVTDWEQVKSKVRQAVISRLEKAGFTDIGQHIKFELCHTPESWQETFNVSKGATFGSLSHSIFQMGWFRPHNRHARYKNLYFTGGSTHPGNGVPLVLLSAQLTSERIIKEQS